MLTAEQFEEIKKFNQNIDWIRKNQKSVPLENESVEWIKIPEAMKILERGRTWLQCRLLKPEDVKPPMNVHWFLVRGIDWEREGNQLIFKRTSINRLKQELKHLGQLYDEKITRHN